MNGLTTEAGSLTSAEVGAAEPIAGSIAATTTPDAAMMRKEDLAKEAIVGSLASRTGQGAHEQVALLSQEVTTLSPDMP